MEFHFEYLVFACIPDERYHRSLFLCKHVWCLSSIISLVCLFLRMYWGHEPVAEEKQIEQKTVCRHWFIGRSETSMQKWWNMILFWFLEFLDKVIGSLAKSSSHGLCAISEWHFWRFALIQGKKNFIKKTMIVQRNAVLQLEETKKIISSSTNYFYYCEV